MASETHEDDVQHKVERVYGRCAWCGLPQSWDPEGDELCEACNSVLSLHADPENAKDDEHKRRALVMRVACGVERLVELVDEFVRRGRDS